MRNKFLLLYNEDGKLFAIYFYKNESKLYLHLNNLSKVKHSDELSYEQIQDILRNDIQYVSGYSNFEEVIFNIRHTYKKMICLRKINIQKYLDKVNI